MVYILFWIGGIALGFWIKGKIKKPFTPKQAEEMEKMRAEAKEALYKRTEHRKGKILEFMKNEAVHQKELEACNPEIEGTGIVSSDIEKLLEVSNGTARKYLNELEDENKIKQIGTSGRDVYYILNI